MRLLALLTATTLAGGLATNDLRYTRMVEGAGGRHVAVEPDGPMFAHARAGFADVRVLDADGEQVPWRTRPRPSGLLEEPVLVLNSGREGGAAVALFDLGPRRALRDRITLEVPPRPFVGRAVVFGSDRRAGPYTRLGATAIYDVRGAQPARSTTVVFAVTDYRFLRVRATGVARITAARLPAGPAQPYSVQRVPERTAIRRAGRQTIVTLDFGFRNVPVDELRIAAGTRRYDRPVVIEATNERFGRNWRVVAAGRISRFPGAVPSTVAVATRSRYVRVRIDNGDDPPLERISVRALSRSHALVLEGGHPAPYSVYYGAPGARMPNYEFARIPLPAGVRIAEGSLTPERLNPDFDAPERSFGERHGWIVSAALVAAAAVVGAAGFLALRRRA